MVSQAAFAFPYLGFQRNLCVGFPCPGASQGCVGIPVVQKPARPANERAMGYIVTLDRMRGKEFSAFFIPPTLGRPNVKKKEEEGEEAAKLKRKD